MSDNTPPPMPWVLRPAGICLGAAFLIPTSAAIAHVPAALSVVSILPGFTLGGLFYAEYGPGSALQYHELVVVTSAVRLDGRIAWHVAEILVDSASSLEAGRAQLGVPKYLAGFRHAPGSLEIVKDGQPYLSWQYSRPWWFARVNVYAEAVNADVDDRDRIRACGNSIAAYFGSTQSTIDVHAGPANGLFSSRPLISVAGKDAKALFGQILRP